MMGSTAGNEGYAHPDSKHKIITVLLGFSREWPYERGRMPMFRVRDHSYHGFLPQKGQRMSLPLCDVDSEAYVRKQYMRHSVSACARSVPLLRKIIDMAPRRLPGAR